ncbi:MAG: iron-containing redox enzyme family protein [Deltaproteobacteria bacterium]|nr:iron-containing redox enzyme family protein [Deltaproteobacteria bacterium]
MSSNFIDQLKAALAPEQMRLWQTRLAKALIADDKAPLSIWRAYLWESYHYVKHNGVNQALAVLRTPVTDKELQIRYLKHAAEEIDHDLLCLHDLEKIGVARETVIASRPLPETAAFSSFLYDFVMRENPIGRLGYSYWAEGSADYGDVLIPRLKHHFGLPDDAMRFVVEHRDLDRGHKAACEKTIEKFALKKEDQEAILYFGVATCHQFFYVLEAMYDRAMREA